jgi:outer membrane protein OmpA-like peptidoglycan-associated protein
MIHTIPPAGDVLFEGKPLGVSPTTLKVNSIAELSDRLKADNLPGNVLEQRIQILPGNKADVVLIFDPAYTKMAKILGLHKILVFDYHDEITFETASSKVKPEFQQLLAKQSELLKQYFKGMPIYICGHSDSVGDHSSNMALSLERAKSVSKILTSSGVPASSIKVHGFGPDFPIISNNTEAGRSRNRRIEIILGR